jgi:hypothetical protein
MLRRCNVKTIRAFLMVLLFTSTVRAQWTPVVSKVKETTKVSGNGQPIKAVQKEGSFYRRSDGSILVEWTSVDGDPGRAVGSLSFGQTNLRYQLNIASRTAIEREVVSPPGVDSALDPARMPKTPMKPLREEFVGTVACAVFPLYRRQRPEAPPVPSGEACWSHELGLMLKRESTYVGSDGRTYHTTYESYDIDIREPDPALFDLQGRGFTVFRKGNALNKP